MQNCVQILRSTIAVLLVILPEIMGIGMQEIQHPPCSFNPLCSCSTSGPSLGNVQCHNVKLSTVPENIKGSNLYVLSLQRNHLRTVENSSFHGTTLFSLEISENDITHLSSLALRGLEKHLWKLHLNKNHLYNIPKDAIKNLQKLTTLDLSHNYITSIDGNDLRALGSTLKNLNLAGNAISHINSNSFKDLRALTELNLKSNFINTIHDTAFKSGLPSLQDLNLANNHLEKIPFASVSFLKRLSNLDLSGNAIVSTYDELFQGKLSLSELRLNDNSIGSLEAYSFKNFQSINRTFLSGNAIEVIHDEAFKGTRINEIYMSFCELWNISSKAFSGLESSLRVLDLGYNDLTVFPKEALSEIENLQEVGLKHNHVSVTADSLEYFQYTLQHLDLTGQGLEVVRTTEETENIFKLRNIRRLSISVLDNNALDMEDLEYYGSSTEYLALVDASIVRIENDAFQNVPGLKMLDLSGNNIRNIATDAFKDVANSLRVLNMSKSVSMNVFPAYALHHLRNLEELDLSDNHIETLLPDSFAYIPNLKHLYLDFNQIREISKDHFLNSNLPGLISIHMAFNRLKEIYANTFEGLSKLRLIDLSDNAISSIQASAFINLESIEFINLAGNDITNIDTEAFVNIPRLRDLDLSFNSLEHLNLDAFDQVGTLSTFRIDTKYNKLNTLEVGNDTTHIPMVSTNTLDFSHNNISYIQEEYFEPVRRSLTHLVLSHNAITELSLGVFSDMTHLQTLELDNNFIQDIDSRSLQGTANLQVLNLSHNKITNLPSNLFKQNNKLRIFDVSYNLLDGLPDGYLSKTSTEFFYAQDNMLKHFPDKALQGVNNTIRGIYVAGNNIRSLGRKDLQGFKNLLELDLSRNNLKLPEEGTFSRLDKLVDLDLSHNQFQRITTATFKGLDDTLESLNLSGANLTAIPLLNLPRLLRLNISHNSIRNLEQSSFFNTSNIILLDLTANQLTQAPNNIWNILTHLRTLHLSGNPIANIYENCFNNLQSLNELYIQDLPLEQLHNEAFKPLSSLRTVATNDYTSLDEFRLGYGLSESHGLKHVILKVDLPKGYASLHLEKLPRGVKSITIQGESLEVLDNLGLDKWPGYDLDIRIKSTNVTRISKQMFNDMSNLRRLKVDVRNNRLSYMEDLSELTSSSQGNYKIELQNLLLSGNPWKCDCEMAWVMEWIKSVFQRKQVKETGASVLMQDLRQARCRNNDKSLMEFLKSSPDCRVAKFKGSNSQGLTNNLALNALSVIVPIMIRYA